MHIETFIDRRGEHRFRLKADNGLTLAVSSEGYKDKRDLDHCIHLFRKAHKAKVVKV